MDCKCEMAKSDEQYPMLPHPDTHPIVNHNSGAVFRVLSCVFFITATRSVLRSTSECDVQLRTWMNCLNYILAVLVVREAVLIGVGQVRLVKWISVTAAAIGTGMWLWGNAAVSLSEKCDLEVWFFVFILLLWVDIAAVFLGLVYIYRLAFLNH